MSLGIEEWLAGVRSALETNDDAQLMDQFRLDLREDEVFVFTPKGDIFKLPMGATVLDFAYHIHSKVGNQCVGARVGGKNVTIRQKLQSGDQVEILTRHQSRTGSISSLRHAPEPRCGRVSRRWRAVRHSLPRRSWSER